MIALTFQKLTVLYGTGALQRFFACQLSIAAWRGLRHTAAACESEMLAFQKKRDELVTSLGGKVRLADAAVDFTDPEKGAQFGRDFAELLATKIELPGEPIGVEDVREGALTAADHVNLAPFFRPDIPPAGN